MTLNKQEKQALVQKAHHLEPVVIIGNKGLTAAVQQEIDISLEKHELIKIKLPTSERGIRDQIIQAILAEQEAELVQTIGRVAVIHRSSEGK